MVGPPSRESSPNRGEYWVEKEGEIKRNQSSKTNHLHLQKREKDTGVRWKKMGMWKETGMEKEKGSVRGRGREGLI